MSINFQSPNVILIYFPAFAGGKFISNCLGLSKHCIITDNRFVEQDLQYQIFDQKFYNFKINSILTTLPPLHRVNNWRLYELREWECLGILNDDYANLSAQKIYHHSFDPVLEKIVDSGRHHCFISHRYEVTQGFKHVWPNAQIISLVNWNKFIKIAGEIKKSPGEDISSHLDYLLDFPTTLPWPSLIFDVDHSMFSRDNFLRSIKTLYLALKFTDFNPDLIGRYYDEYHHLHKF